MFTLDGIRVVDLGTRAATAWCSRLLADFGAEVLAVEPPGGHPLRRHPPFDAAGRSIAARYFLANKASVPAGDAAALDAADVIVTSGLDAPELADAHGHAIVCAITPHGLAGPYRDFPGNDLTAAARSGWASVNGLAGRPPLKGSGYQASFQAGTVAWGTVVCALIERLANESSGQLIDISEFETLVSTFAPAPLRVQTAGFVWSRREQVDMNEGPVPVSDGYFALPISRPHFWIRAMEILGLPDLADDEELQQPGLRHKFKDRFVDRVEERMVRWNRQALFDALARERVIAGPVFRMDEMARNPQFEGRGFFVRSPEGTRFPGPPARMGRSGWSLEREMGEAGADGGDFGRREAIGVTPVRAGQGAYAASGKGPLDGFRGLVLTQAWAGTYATELLALLGAEVIQVESRTRIDSWRGSFTNPVPKLLREVPTARRPWNCSPMYNSVNLNKLGITLDLSEPDGVALFKGLVPHVDFVAENFSPRVMGNLGIDYDALCAVRPDLVMTSLSAYGATGPWSNVPGIGGTIEPSSGMSSLLGYEGEMPQNSGQMYPDPVAGMYGFGAIATALLHRERTGEGQYIDLSMQEANFTFIGDAWLEFETTGGVRGPAGNRHPLHAPHGVYRVAGEDRWIAISAETDAQWEACRAVLGLPGGSWPDQAGRKADEEAVDAAVAAAVAARDRDELERALCAGGVPAAAVRAADEVIGDAALRERGHAVKVHHPETGPLWQSGLPAILDRTPGAVTRPAPCLGEHSFEVFERFLGMARSEYEALVERGVTGEGEYRKAARGR